MKYVKLFENFQSDKELENINSNFKQWFKNSKVMNKSGEPLVVYHGSKSEDITEFVKTSDIGYHFAEAINIAKDMCGEYDDGYGFVRKIPPIACYLSIQNMGELPDLEFWRKSDLLKEVETENEYRKSKEYPLLNFEYDNTKPLLDNMKIFSKEYSNLDCDWRDIDGFVYYNMYEGRYTQTSKISYIALKPNQIKSIKNDGTWDINDNNIKS